MSYKLEDVSGIGKATAEKLKIANIDSVERLANAKVEDLLKLRIKGVGKTTAEKYITHAKQMLKEMEITEQPSSEVKEKIEEEPISKSKAKPKTKPKTKPVSKEKAKNLKELIKQQAECNIGLVGHVDHGNY